MIDKAFVYSYFSLYIKTVFAPQSTQALTKFIIFFLSFSKSKVSD